MSSGPYSEHFPERRAAEMVAEGVLRVDPDGSVWRIRQYQPGMLDSFPVVEPKRIDYASKRGNRYFEIRLGPNKPCKVQLPRLLWQLAHGDIPPKLTVNHKDGDPTHNTLDNFELMTHSEQHKHRFAVLGHKPAGRLNREFAQRFAEAARLALKNDCEPLRAVLQEYDEREGTLTAQAHNLRTKRSA